MVRSLRDKNHYQIKHKVTSYSRVYRLRLMSKSNERSYRILGNSTLNFTPLCYSGDFQNGITFFLLGSLEKYVTTKFLLCLFSNFFVSLSVSHPFYLLFSKNVGLFCLKLCTLVGNRQTKNIFKKMTSLSMLDAFLLPGSAGCTKNSKFE